MFEIRQDVRDMLGCVPRCVPRRHQCLAESELVALLQFLMFELVFRATFVAHVNVRGIETRLQLARTTHEIGVDVRFENMRNRDACFTCHVDVNVAVRARIENGGNTFIIVAQEIRQLCDAFGLNRFKDERHCKELTRSRSGVQLDCSRPAL